MLSRESSSEGKTTTHLGITKRSQIASMVPTHFFGRDGQNRKTNPLRGGGAVTDDVENTKRSQIVLCLEGFSDSRSFQRRAVLSLKAQIAKTNPSRITKRSQIISVESAVFYRRGLKCTSRVHPGSEMPPPAAIRRLPPNQGAAIAPSSPSLSTFRRLRERRVVSSSTC